MNTDDSAEKICRRMAELRRDLDHDVREVSRGARVISDWKFYVRRFPWPVVGAALVAGYVLVPKRKPVIKPDPEMIQELVRQKKIKVESVTKQPDKPGMMKTLLLTGLTYAARAGAQYVTEQVKTAAHNKARADAAHHEPGPSPLHEPWPSASREG